MITHSFVHRSDSKFVLILPILLFCYFFFCSLFFLFAYCMEKFLSIFSIYNLSQIRSMPLVGEDITPNFATTLNVEWMPWCIIIIIITVIPCK
jgi:hypothetical protein